MNASESVKTFYEHNTRRFLAFGGGRASGVIHREVWGEGVQTKNEAFHYSHHLLLQRLNGIRRTPLRVLDLGCGVGSSLFYLCGHADGPVEATGVTISPTQVIEARARAGRLSLSEQCTFLEADFTHLPEVGLVDLAFSIEAFVHAPDARRYFEQVSSVLAPEGKLFLIDDFLEEKENNVYLERFRKGWRLGSLLSVNRLQEMAGEAGLKLIENQDLTSYLNLDRPRDLFIKALFKIPGIVRLSPEYLMSLDAGDALQTCLKKGWVNYRLIGFKKLKES
jgi:SAM-dependent methyltransferase